MSEQEIPIDIAVRKLVDWLISRRLCQKDWHQHVTAIRTRVGEAMRDMPEHQGIAALLSGAHINYFHCLKIVEILKETEADSKNFFGQYGSQRMKDWKEIVSLYQKDSLYLAEAAQLLTQNVVYEIPGLRKSLVRCDYVEEECDKQEESSHRKEKELVEEFARECKDLGVEGKELRREVIELAKDLPSVYEEVAEQAKGLDKSCAAYTNFMVGMLDEGTTHQVVENLRFLVEQGNVTTYEWKYREKPITVEEPVMVFEEEKEDSATDAGGIDFGDDEIDFGGDDIDFGDSGAEIDFGDEIDFGESEAVESNAIDFSAVDMSDIVVEEGGMAGGVAKDEEALSLLDNRRTRAIIIDELEELRGFLEQRLVESTAEGSKYSLVSGGSQESEASLRSMVSAVAAVLGTLITPKMRQLQLIRGSPEVVGRLVDRLKAKQAQVARVVSSREEIQRKRREAGEERTEVIGQLKLLAMRSKELQGELEEDLSHKYKGRKVNIMGVST